MLKCTLTPVAGENFIGRKELLEELTNDLADLQSQIGYCIYGLRRIGKTSVLRELERLLSSKEKIVVVYFSLWDLENLSPRTFAEEFSRAIISAYQEKGLLKLEMVVKRISEGAKNVVAKIVDKSKVGVRVEEVEFFLTLGERKIDNYSQIIRNAFELSDELAEKTGVKCILMIDEFPDILKIDNGLQIVKMLRTSHEKQEHVGLVISGSLRHTMEEVAISDASPFYKQLVLKKLRPLDLEEVAGFLKTYLGIRDTGLARKLVEVTGGVPFYLQYLGRSAENLKDIDKAVEEFLHEEGGIIFQEGYKNLNETEKGIVSAIAKGHINPKKIAEHVQLPQTALPPYLDKLMDKDMVYRIEKGKYGLLDGMFGRWLVKRF